MARRGRASVRLPRELAGDAGVPPRDGRDVHLRLAVTKHGLGLELAEPASLGAIVVEELALALPGLNFPLDLSGGVPKFRHRRGRLVRLGVAILREPLGEFLEGRMADAIAPSRERAVATVLPHGTGVVLGVAADERAIAWNVVFAPVDRELRLVVERARGVGLVAPSHEVALRAMEAALKGIASRAGSVFRIEDPAGLVARELLLRAGARAPSTDDVVIGALGTHADAWRIEAAVGGVSPALDAEGAQAIETAEILVSADDALATGDRARARDRYLAALERAPHHPEIARRLADLDRAEGGRAEAALATLISAVQAIDEGALGAELLAGVGDRDGARLAYERGGAIEPFAPLAGALLARAAELAEGPAERAELLAAATARAPSSIDVRWRRLDACLELGDVRGALAEVEHLEASAPSVLAKVERLLRASKALASRGHAEESATSLERALRYQPSNEAALVGLGEALSAAGHHARAADVLARAIALGERRGTPRPDAILALARVLEAGLEELPLAIARAKSVPIGAPEHPEARVIEARALAKLGDRAAASVAWARVRDAVEQGRVPDPDRAAAWLSEAARFEEDERDDVLAAKQHLGVALRGRPKNGALLGAFRRVARKAEDRLEAARRAETPHPAAALAPGNSPAEEPLDDHAKTTPPPPAPNAEAEVDDLAAKVRANPADLASVLALAALLESLGRDLEIVALLSARREEGDEATRIAIAPAFGRALDRLAREARAAGRATEAEIYESMRESLG